MPDWDALLAREGRSVWTTAYRILGNRDEADDCFQEAFLDAWKVAERGRPVRHWRGLLIRLVTARAVDRLRARLRRGRAEPVDDWESVPGVTPSPTQPLEDAELPARLRWALAQLPAKQAEAFCLHALDGWSYLEIARQLGASTDAVGVLLHRARRRLRTLMSPTSPEPGVRESDRKPESAPTRDTSQITGRPS